MARDIPLYHNSIHGFIESLGWTIHYPDYRGGVYELYATRGGVFAHLISYTQGDVEFRIYGNGMVFVDRSTCKWVNQ